MTPPRYAAIILAAGFSSRMEAFKPLLPLGKETIADCVISLFAQNGCDVFLIVGWNKAALLSGIKNQDITVVDNSYYKQGMFSSILAGIRRLKPYHEAFFVMPVDIPLVRPTTVRRLLNEAAIHPGKIIYPTFGKTYGHPTLIPSYLIPDIIAWQEDSGLKTFLQSRKDLAWEVHVPDRNVLFDIDTADDYHEALERFRTYDVPTAEECTVIMDAISPVSQNIRRHCQKVADVAAAMGESLQQCGQKIDLPLVRAAALLHDLAREKPNHAKVGAQMLRDMGFDKVGQIIAAHTDLKAGYRPISIEEKIVFLADKLVEDDRLISLEERYRTWNRRFDITPEIAAKIQQGKTRALKVKSELEKIMANPLEKIINE